MSSETWPAGRSGHDGARFDKDLGKSLTDHLKINFLRSGDNDHTEPVGDLPSPHHICSDPHYAHQLEAKIKALGVPGNFVYEVTHYRNTEAVLMRHIEAEHEKLDEHQHLTVMMPNLVMRSRWARVLHNQTTKNMIRRMEKYRNVYIFQIPYII